MSYLSTDEAYEYNDLACWYQNSIDETQPPIWTDEHLEELLNDFYIIPKETPTADVVPKTELDLLKSTITHKEEKAYNKGYADAKADILEKLQADIVRDEILADYGDEFFEGRIAGFKAVINYLKAESDT